MVAEVHNTYGSGTATCCDPTTRAGPTPTKEFYVSPFYPVDGYYRMSLPEPGERLAITMTLHRPGEPPVHRVRARRAPTGDPPRRARDRAAAPVRDLARCAR